MGCIAALIALAFPRILIAVLWFFTTWFQGVYDGILIPILGFIFMPVTLLWYSVVINYYGGQWTVVPVLGMVIAIVIDLGSGGNGVRHGRRRG